jgi:glutaredoxin-related protein
MPSCDEVVAIVVDLKENKIGIDDTQCSDHCSNLKGFLKLIIM